MTLDDNGRDRGTWAVPLWQNTLSGEKLSWGGGEQKVIPRCLRVKTERYAPTGAITVQAVQFNGTRSWPRADSSICPEREPDQSFLFAAARGWRPRRGRAAPLSRRLAGAIINKISWQMITRPHYCELRSGQSQWRRHNGQVAPVAVNGNSQDLANQYQQRRRDRG